VGPDLQEISMAELNSHIRFPRYVQFRAPEKLPEVIAAAAEKKLTTASEYVRQAIIKELKADGFEKINAA
jgi:hypothetical protein